MLKNIFLEYFCSPLGVKLLKLMEPLKTSEWAYNDNWKEVGTRYTIKLVHKCGLNIVDFGGDLEILFEEHNLNQKLTFIDKFLIKLIIRNLRNAQEKNRQETFIKTINLKIEKFLKD